MNRLITIQIFFLLLALGAAGMRIHDRAYAEETISEAVQREMPVLKGDQWIAMDENAKVAFIWGAGHVVTIEEVIMEKYPDQKRDTFVTKVVEASKNTPMTMNQVVATVDKFYQENPDMTDKPVMAVIWDIMIEPNIQKEIGDKSKN